MKMMRAAVTALVMVLIQSLLKSAIQLLHYMRSKLVMIVNQLPAHLIIRSSSLEEMVLIQLVRTAHRKQDQMRTTLLALLIYLVTKILLNIIMELVKNVQITPR